MNQAFLAKIGWNLCLNDQSLWVKVLKAKYFANDSYLQVEAKNDCSFTWKSILSARQLVENGVAYLIRDGKTAHFWLDTWLGNDPLILKAMGNLTELELSSTVHQYWNERE